MDGTDCEICFHHYDDQTRLPRTLPCGHTLCTVCITDSISHEQMSCPYCRQIHNISDAKDISITFALLSLSLNRSASVTEENSTLSGSESPTTRPLRSTMSTSSLSCLVTAEPAVHAGVCLSHRSFKLFWCSECMVWICRDCCVVDHPSKTCSIISIDQALRNLKEEEEILFANNRESYTKHLKFLRDYQKKLDNRAEDHETQVSLFQALNESHAGTINLLRKERERIEASLKEAEIALKRMDAAKDHFTKMNTVESIQSSRRELQIRTKILNEWISGSKDEILNLSVMQMSDELGLEIKIMLIAAGYSIGNPLEDAGFLVTQAKQMFRGRINTENIRTLAANHQIWAVTQDNDHAAPLVLQDGRLHLYCLREGTAPPGAFILPYANVRCLVQKSTQVFLDFSWLNAAQNTVYITFGDNENLHTSLIRRCTGELPPCFKNTSVHVHSERRNPHLAQVYAGAHSNLKLFKKVSGPSSPCNPGNGLVTLGISNGLPCFVIWYKAHAQSYNWTDVPIGRVTGGSDVIEAIAMNTKASDVRLVDSGLVIL